MSPNYVTHAPVENCTMCDNQWCEFGGWNGRCLDCHLQHGTPEEKQSAKAAIDWFNTLTLHGNTYHDY